jgi:carbon-monoxide dehydrogenase large subunit
MPLDMHPTSRQNPPEANAIGQPVRRKEDLRLVTGNGRYSDDFNLPHQVYAAMVRSPFPNAVIKSIDKGPAMSVPGVLAVFTGADASADGLGSMLHDHPVLGSRELQRLGPDPYLENRDGSDALVPPHYILPFDRARFVGEPVAVVIAKDPNIAKDGAEKVEVVYATEPFVTSARAAVDPESPLVHSNVPANTCLDADLGDQAATTAAFARATKIVRIDTHIQRVTGVTMEPRAALGNYNPVDGRYTLYAGSSGVVRHKMELAAVLRVSPDLVRVVARDVGGNFGTRNNFYPEFGLVAWASRRVGRPVKWTSERTESFTTDYQGRDLSVEAELAVDAEGNFLGLRGSNISNLGAHCASFVPLRKGIGLMSSVYAIPAAFFRGRGVLTNTVPTTPYRSAGRPEAMFVIERLVDMAALVLGMDRVEIRRKNLIPAEALPFKNPLGVVYDNGNYAATMAEALQHADWASFEARRAEAKSRNMCRGIGLANYIEITMGLPREKAELTVLPNGQVELVIGTMASGQGHETTFSQVAAEWLGVPFESVQVITGDTDRVSVGGGSVSGRSMRFASVVIAKSVEQIVAKSRKIFAHAYGVRAEEVSFAEGKFSAAGTPAELSVFDVARAARERNDLPDELRGPLYGQCDELFRAAGFPYGAQVCEVEVDPQTGVVSIERFTAIDDVGKAVNPMILHGQTHGGAAQGIGQALMEQSYYDPESGQPLAGSLMDYSLPRATDLPNFCVGISEVPSPSNPLGIRAGGEGGTTPALASVVNAVVDALSEYGIKHLEMPLTSGKVWQAIRDARAQR